MADKIINAGKGKKYLSEVIDFIPPNTIFNKGTTGCGGTHLEITSSRHSIITGPFTNFIINKRQQSGDKIMGVFAGISEEEIISYLNNDQVTYKKIMVTYDSIDRVIAAISKCNMLTQGRKVNVYTDFFLLIDEYHVLLNQYVFRNDAITRLLKVFPCFRLVTFMSATPLKESLMLEELKHISSTKVVWEDVTEVVVKPVETKSPIGYVKKIIKQRLNNEIFGNLHFFVNSVSAISKILKALNIPAEDVNVVCANKPENQYKLGSKYVITNNIMNPKAINFYTSTAFEGVDIYDKDGKTFIVSDGKISHTLTDISTLFIQICGRIRDSRYNGEVTHVYSTSYRYNAGQRSLQDYIEFTERQIHREQKYAKSVNAMPDREDRERTINDILKNNQGNPYLRKSRDGKIELDMNRVKVDRMNYEITNHVYSSRLLLNREYQQNGLKSLPTEMFKASDTFALKPSAKIPFRSSFEEYVLLNENIGDSIGSRQERIDILELERPLVKEAYQRLGVAEVRRMKYNLTNIKGKLSLKISDTESVKIQKLLRAQLQMNVPLKVAYISKKISEIYKLLNIQRPAKSTDIINWFESQTYSKRYDGQPAKSVILSERLIL